MSVLNAVTWFEIPAADFDRAVQFYSTVLAAEMRTENFMGIPNAFFPFDQQGVGGAVVLDPDRKPSYTGSLVYLNAGTPENLDRLLSRVEAAGGGLVVPRTDIGEPGYIAVIRDTEGNQVGLHAPRTM
ncbi:MAG: VOC family protein [Anaerolineae bacterium]|nr:VOC family protein [Anaerolineae bacterium]